MSVKGLERLKVWCRARDFALLIYKEALKYLPPEEKWALDRQLRRAAQSIPANIAEGYGHYYYQENIRFCYVARGSLDETLSHIVLAHQAGYIPEDLYFRLVKEGEDLDRLINGYIAYLKQSRQGAKEPGFSSQIHEVGLPYANEMSPENEIDPAATELFTDHDRDDS